MFVGTHTHKLDDKGRLTLPAKFRDQLAEGMMVSQSQDRSLTIYLPADFTELAERASAASKVNEGARAFQRRLMSSTEEMTPDSQGRISLSSEHRVYAGLKKDCVVIGNYDHVEIWDAESWQQYQRQNEESFSKGNDESLRDVL